MDDNFQDIYIYINTRGVIHEIPAFISKTKPLKLTFAIPAFDSDNKIVHEVAKEPGMIFNNSIWFKKKNYDKARELFINDYGQRINKLYSELNDIEQQMTYLLDQEKYDGEEKA